MSIYKGDELISGRVGAMGRPGMNSSGGSDMGSKIITITPGQWVDGGGEYTRTITRYEHGMAASPALLVFTAENGEGDTALYPMDTDYKVTEDGTIVLRSSRPWNGVCVVAGGISQALDAVARQAIQDEADRATTAESGLQAAIAGEKDRAEAAEAQAVADANAYTDEQIADAVAAAQKWLPAVATASDLPTITDTTKTYLCRVVKSNDVYQCVAGQTAWALYSDNTDYIDPEELADAIQVETNRATEAESGLGGRLDAVEGKTAAHSTTGTATAYAVTAEGVSATNGAVLIFTPHTDAGEGVTLNLNGTGAKPVYIKSTGGTSKRQYHSFVAGATYTAAYSAADDGWVLLNASYPDYTEVLNTPPLYGATGQNTDGAMTQKATTDALNALASGAFVPYVATVAWAGSAGNYTYTLAASVHGKGTTPLITTLQSGNIIDCSPYIDSAGNITLYSNANLANIKLEVR